MAFEKLRTIVITAIPKPRSARSPKLGIGGSGPALATLGATTCGSQSLKRSSVSCIPNETDPSALKVWRTTHAACYRIGERLALNLCQVGDRRSREQTAYNGVCLVVRRKRP
jgi:hypothetical protein